MTSFKQIEANRRNAGKSTGPVTDQGKRRSRCNAVRHGLTAETVIRTLEDAEDYRAFEAAIIADYDAQSAVERELILRLANLLWRLRRATAIETGLFEIQARQLLEFQHTRAPLPNSRIVTSARLGLADLTVPSQRAPDQTQEPAHLKRTQPTSFEAATDLASCFLRLANLPNFALDRLSRYEAAMWRQAGQIVLTLQALERRRPGRSWDRAV